MGLKIFKTGEWDKVKTKLDYTLLTKGIEEANDQAMRNVVATGERIVVKLLYSQSLSWPALKASTLKRKLGKSPQGSSKILFDTSTYAQSITSVFNKAKREGFIGVRRISMYKNGESIANIAAIHEYGVKSKNIPKRALFLPAKNLLIAWVRIKKPFIDEYKKRL